MIVGSDYSTGVTQDREPCAIGLRHADFRANRHISVTKPAIRHRLAGSRHVRSGRAQSLKIIRNCKNRHSRCFCHSRLIVADAAQLPGIPGVAVPAATPISSGMSDNSSLGGRVRRYVKAGRAVSGLAARVAGERYLGVKFDRKEHAAELRASLGGLKGPLMKVAQLLSTIPEALPREYAQELAQLQSDAPPMGWAFVRRRMAAELGPDWRGRFKQFDQEASAAASLGQVHRAITKDEVSVACKLQYPEMASVVAADLKQLRIIFRGCMGATTGRSIPQTSTRNFRPDCWKNSTMSAKRRTWRCIG